jgi:hypothetical protein
MIRLHIIVEGQTEEAFVNQVLAVHLGTFNVSTDVHAITTSRGQGALHRGGWNGYHHLKRDLERWMQLRMTGERYCLLTVILSCSEESVSQG